jgi:hypothetical protein
LAHFPIGACAHECSGERPGIDPVFGGKPFGAECVLFDMMVAA